MSWMQETFELSLAEVQREERKQKRRHPGRRGQARIKARRQESTGDDLVGKASNYFVGNTPLPLREVTCPSSVLNQDSENIALYLQSSFQK